jgi:methylenetetrahydrofolate reductase (NADPH)
VIQRLDDAGPEGADEGVRLTVEVVAKLKTVEGIAGIHVMGLGQMDPVRKVIAAAGLLPRPVVA